MKNLFTKLGMKENILKDKSFIFAKQIILFYKDLIEIQKEFIISKQLLKSGTSIGASNISLKEANETIYRLDFLYETNYITKQYMFLKEACEELIKLLVKSIKTSKG